MLIRWSDLYTTEEEAKYEEQAELKSIQEWNRKKLERQYKRISKKVMK